MIQRWLDYVANMRELAWKDRSDSFPSLDLERR